MRKLTVRCLPKDLPDQIDVNVEKIKLGHSVQVKNISADNLEFLENQSRVVASVKLTRLARGAAAAAEEGEEGEEGATEEAAAEETQE